jgi:Ca2+-binding EF-hand superfamily protein
MTEVDQIQTAEFRQAFDEFDKDGSGAVSSKETALCNDRILQKRNLTIS